MVNATKKTNRTRIISLLALISAFCLQTLSLVSQEEVFTLCYHNIFRISGEPGPCYISAGRLEEQLKYFRDEGYRSVLPEDIFKHINGTEPLDKKCILFSFDDTHESHYTISAPLLEKYGFRGTFFIMTVVIGKKHYMTGAQIKSLADRGHCIANHTYDHQDLRKLPAGQWKKQIEDSNNKLEKITGTNICFFAYPFGACNRYAAENLQKRGMELSFQLSGKQIPGFRLQSQRRLMVSGTWSSGRLNKEMLRTFRKQ